ncbi:sigma-70 family RNA polymerase sigma factor [Mucilaginibacter daejeonensis]|uniref:RNA polymerase sigma factor n=1 Tax=Mucilaginibacter daejeonensis TaxID=398049 RepID=UPI001D16FC06|nr:sigma-70 family RNA polymerase sigma factor [Mucilaginibacter daejeonensis]UEG51356.1 sigma-70 family RNA polymerase sigma factor [Mucilaginibacter daejeonensis]
MSELLYCDSDDELLSKFRIGDEKALNQIFSKLYGGLCFFASRFTTDIGIAEELTIDVFQKAWDRRETFHELTSLKAFLYISIKNASLDHIDKEKRRALRMSNFFSAYNEMEAAVIDNIIHTEVINELRQEIDALPEQCAKIMKMLYLLEMTPDEIAVELNISRNTVYSQKLRGISLLKKRSATFQLVLLALLFTN